MENEKRENEKTKNGKTVLTDIKKRLKSNNENGNGNKKYFSFGLSIIDNETNKSEIDDLKTLIEIVKRKFGYTDVKNKTLITDLLIYVAEN